MMFEFAAVCLVLLLLIIVLMPFSIDCNRPANKWAAWEDWNDWENVEKWEAAAKPDE